MKTFSLTKCSITLLLITLPLNFLVLEGLGSVYLSTAIIFVNFLIVLFLSRGRIIAKKKAIAVFVVFVYLILTTLVNVVFNKGIAAKEQIVFSVIHLQLVLAFILGNYYSFNLKRDFFYKLLITIIAVFSVRIFIDDLDKVFNLSSVRGLRVETIFAGGANNFALIVGIGFIACFFYLKKGFFKTLLCLYFLAIIILTMSRGALLGLVFTLFIVAIYDIRGKILSSLLKTSFVLTIIGIVLLMYSENGRILAEQFSERFLSLFTGETSIEKASSGRGLIIRDLYENHIKQSSFYEMLFGHGMGSINFKVNGYPYESSHNIIVDVFYRNGLLAIIGFIALFMFMFYTFLKNRKNTDLAIFGFFIFLHFEILVNPFVYAAQTGWIYGLLLAVIINRISLLK